MDAHYVTVHYLPIGAKHYSQLLVRHIGWKTTDEELMTIWGLGSPGAIYPFAFAVALCNVILAVLCPSHHDWLSGIGANPILIVQD
eukprot:CAMPEP_0181500426 /NCGR_PEP_ID=MMETSP1110-20121109/55213_1 /TAXON_ID=174948 /ORGANISM="Symbiodinium sp., Strain CCMP421" /LENGTH=85 /DNA_ID=CAMNT_0023628733 /DNA_START=532 /DNA_END=789 /DNA_ORIENTATION=+